MAPLDAIYPSGTDRGRSREAACTILAVDQGTSATKAVVFGDDGGDARLRGGRRDAARASRAAASSRTPSSCGTRSARRAGTPCARSGGGVAAVGVANQGETVLAWDRATGRPLSAAISWQDRRAAAICAELAGEAAQLTRTTGLPLDPYFAAPKMAWLRRHVTTEGVVTTTDTWLLHRLTGAFVTDATTASRTLLLDLGRRTWSEEACAAFGLRPGTSPPSSAARRRSAGRTRSGAARRERLERRPAGGARRGALPRDRASRSARTAPARSCWPTPARSRSRSSAGLAVSVAWQLGERRRLLHRRAGLRRRCGRRLAAPVGVPGPVRGSRRRGRLGGRRRRRHRRARPQRPRRAVVATRRAGQHRGDRAGHRAGARRPGDGRGPGGAGDVVGPRRRSGPRPPAHAAAGGRGADPLAAAHADAGRPAPGPGGSGVFAARHRGRCGGPGPARRRRGRDARRGRPTSPRRTGATSRRSPPTRRPRAWSASSARWRAWWRRRERRPHLRRGGHRCRRGGHGDRAPAGPLPAAHRRARAVQRRGDGHLEGQHRHPPHRLRHEAREPRIDAGPAGPRAPRRLCGQRRASPSSTPGRCSSPGTRSRRRASTRWWPTRGPTGTSAPSGSRSRSCTGASRTSAEGRRGPSRSPTSASSAPGARASPSPPRRWAPGSSCGSASR